MSETLQEETCFWPFNGKHDIRMLENMGEISWMTNISPCCLISKTTVMSIPPQSIQLTVLNIWLVCRVEGKFWSISWKGVSVSEVMRVCLGCNNGQGPCSLCMFCYVWFSSCLFWSLIDWTFKWDCCPFFCVWWNLRMANCVRHTVDMSMEYFRA